MKEFEFDETVINLSNVYIIIADEHGRVEGVSKECQDDLNLT